MPAERAPMRKVREVLRLKHALGASEREIAVSVGIGRSTVAEYLRRAAFIGITWPAGMDDGELARRSRSSQIVMVVTSIARASCNSFSILTSCGPEAPGTAK